METKQIVLLVVSLLGPLAAAPLMISAAKHLFALFLREGASLFVGLEMHKEWSMEVGASVAMINIATFIVGWWGSVVLHVTGFSSFAVIAPLLAAVALCLLFTMLFLRARLALDPVDALMVSLLTFAGGNLPLILAFPTVLIMVSTGGGEALDVD